MEDRRAARTVSRFSLAAAATGALFALAQPGVAIWPLVFVCLMPLLVAMRGQRLVRRLALAWIAGTVAATLTAALPVAVALSSYFDLAGWQAALGSAAVGQVFGAAPVVLFAVLCGDPARGHPATAALRVGGAWMAAEWVRGVLFTGLPWMLLAHALAPAPAVARTAALGGALFVSAWLAAVNALAASLVADRRRGTAAVALVAVVAALALHAALPPRQAGGEVRRFDADAASLKGAAQVVLVQGNISNADRHDPLKLIASVRRLAELERTAPGAGAETDADLVIWPENAVSAVLPFNVEAVRHALAPYGRSGGHRLLGAPRADRDDPSRIHTSAVLLDAELRAVAHHDKVRLLPFAEFVPWPFTPSPGPQTAPGSRPKLLQAGPLMLGPLVCYEILFPEIARSLVRDGAGVLVNVSNDSWFGRTSGLDQHLAAAVLRAIEFGRPLLRSTSTGVTAAIDARGVVVARLPIGEPGALRLEVAPGHGQTLYARVGDAGAWTALLVTALLSLLELRSQRQPSS